MSRHLGLIIGVNHYQDETFQSLRFAENDARALAQWLVNAKGGQWSPPDVQLVQGQYATRELVESLITQILINKAEPGDVIFFYFAGHAFVDEQTGEGYLALANSRYQDPSTSVSLLSFTQHILARSQASHILCAFDCFQNGQFWRVHRTFPFDSKPLLGSTLLATLQQLHNRLFLCSCRGNEGAPEVGEGNLGLLARSMIVGLCGPAQEPANASVLLPALHAFLFNTLDEQHRPQLFGQQHTPLILVGPLPAPTVTRSFSGPSAEQLAPSGVRGTTSGSSTMQQPLAGNVMHSSTVFPQETLQSAPFTSGHIQTSVIDDQRQQQSQQMLEQALHFFQAQNYSASFSLVEQILRLTPTNVEALILKGQLLGLAGRFPEAMTVIDQLLQLYPNNSMGWSMRAVALTNLGNHQDALAAIERSLEMDAQNPESYAIKNTIMANLALVQTQTNKHPQSKFVASRPKRSLPVVFVLGLGLHLLGLVVGFAGFAALMSLRNLPPMLALLPISIGLTIVCVNAARGSFHFGFVHVILALLLSLLAGGILGLAYRMGMTPILAQLKLHPSLLVPLTFLVAWLAVVAVVPLLLALGGFIGGLVSRSGKRS